MEPLKTICGEARGPPSPGSPTRAVFARWGGSRAHQEQKDLDRSETPWRFGAKRHKKRDPAP